MASVGESVRKSLQDFDLGDIDFSMLHACNAVDGTAKKLFPNMRVAERFTRVLRDNYLILGPFGIPGINLVETRWPVKVRSPKAPGGLPDAADVIYGIHRCTHGHGEEMPAGFELIRNANSTSQNNWAKIEKGQVQFFDNLIFGMLAVAVASPVNAAQNATDGCYLTLHNMKFNLKDWWGKREDLLAILSQMELPVVTINFAHMMDLE